MNACQAVMKPDGTKASTNKSAGIRKALTSALEKCLKEKETLDGNESREAVEEKLQEMGIMFLIVSTIPSEVCKNASMCTMEFAGVKFKGSVTSGDAYIQFVSNAVVQPLLRNFPDLNTLIICEEKYSFTPDLFKASTRQSRQKNKPQALYHLQDDHEILASDRYNTTAIRGSMKGKRMVSSYLAAHMDNLAVSRDISIIIDSEYQMGSQESEGHGKYAIPIETIFKRGQGFVSQHQMVNIHQCKGEAEMSQADWLPYIHEKLASEDKVISYVTSGDIDAVPIHMVAVALHWPRNEDGTFQWPVFVVLHKPQGKMDVFNITKLVECFEQSFQDHDIGLKVAILLCMGGNDFLPRYHGHSHEKLLMLAVSDKDILDKLLTFKRNGTGNIVNCVMDVNIFVKLIQQLYCPASLRSLNLNFEEVRQITVRNPTRKDTSFKHPHSWLPPKSALEKIGGLVNSQIEYLLSVCDHSAKLPDFIQNGGLKVNKDGTVDYDLGADCFISDPSEILTIPEDELKDKMKMPSKRTKKSKTKRYLELTPQKTPQGKRQMTSTPKHRSSNV